MTTLLMMKPSTKITLLMLGLMAASFLMTGCASNSD